MWNLYSPLLPPFHTCRGGEGSGREHMNEGEGSPVFASSNMLSCIRTHRTVQIVSFAK